MVSSGEADDAYFEGEDCTQYEEEEEDCWHDALEHNAEDDIPEGMRLTHGSNPWTAFE